jgi:hypothetical protein
MEVKLALLADAANVSREGKLNILGIFNTIHAGSFPAVHPKMYLVLSFETTNAEAGKTKRVEIVFVDADDTKLGSIAGKLIVPKGEPGYPIQINHIFPIPPTPFSKPGDYVFNISINEDHKKAVSLKVVQLKTAGGKRVG